MIAAHTARGAGVRGRLDLVFEAAGGRTVLSRAHVLAPLKIVRPFDLHDGRVLVQILTLGPGMCGGDEYAIDVTVRAGARAVVITQSAARVIGMADRMRAAQHVNVAVEAGGHFEYYPGLTIPFRDSRFVQRVHVAAARDSCIGLLETWGTGRMVRGEHLAFRSISSRTTVSIDGEPVYADAVELDPGQADVGGAGVLEGHRYAASGFWHGAVLEPGASLARCDGVLAAFGQTRPRAVYLRALAMDGCAMADATAEAVRLVNAAWGLAPIPLRRFTS